MTTELQGELDGQGLRVGIVVSRFNDFITSKLLLGTKSALSQNGVRDHDMTVASVPGSFEIPLIAKNMAERGSFDAVICLGAVIKGETDHYVYIAGEVSRGIARAGLETGVPIIFGVLTCDTLEQAINRAGGESGVFVEKPRVSDKAFGKGASTGHEQGNVGYNAGVAAIEMANLIRRLDSNNGL